MLVVPIQALNPTFVTLHPSLFPLSSIAFPGLILLYLWEGKEVLEDDPGKTARKRDTFAQKHMHELNNTVGTYTCHH